ncbi:G-protein coupled receptor 83-like [Uloborus diversus]|uniref:G-protein coupled receptor 83-like n=1 Tax=Uloborus diversus TaxID=327109 RepID=UPI00240A17CD|nr:G-protein coupled receptor 83-like [Uloborus diversus]
MEKLFLTLNNTLDFNINDLDFGSLRTTSNFTFREILIVVCYGIIIVISLFGNLLVCSIVIQYASMRRATYVFIANLAVSDLLMTVLNIPFNVARILLDNWPFGSFMCSLLPLVQVTSVYVSTFTMTCIAVDRYRVISKPFRPRLRLTQALVIISFVWAISIVLAVPHAMFNKVESFLTYEVQYRCRTIYPAYMSQWITLITFTTQYFLPLSTTGFFYSMIVSKVWSRDVLGVVTEVQVVSQAKAKKKTIKMLIIVVILFAICWLPLNLYHILKEFKQIGELRGSSASIRGSTIFFCCHWFAMSSVCYNPFIYCWLNAQFRSGAFACLHCVRDFGSKINSSLRSPRGTKLKEAQYDVDTMSFEMKSDSNASGYGGRYLNSFRAESRRSRLRTTQATRFIPLVPITKSECNLCEEECPVMKRDFYSVTSLNSSSNPKTKLHKSLRKSSSWT